MGRMAARLRQILANRAPRAETVYRVTMFLLVIWMSLLTDAIVYLMFTLSP